MKISKTSLSFLISPLFPFWEAYSKLLHPFTALKVTVEWNLICIKNGDYLLTCFSHAPVKMLPFILRDGALVRYCNKCLKFCPSLLNWHLLVHNITAFVFGLQILHKCFSKHDECPGISDASMLSVPEPIKLNAENDLKDLGTHWCFT